ncbi:MAG: hypothetical protein HY722_04325, partial [Planctomycetes bacterium]|nr:hypothetical protein [Planctomycetota bacterium]
MTGKGQSMRCDEIQNDALFEVLDALPGADPEGEALRAHVAGCPACAARLSALGRVREALRGRTCPEVDPAVDAAVMTLARSEAARRRGTGGTVTPGWWEPALVAAAAALVLGVG